MTKCQPLRGARDVVGSCSWRTRRFTLALVGALPVILLASCSTLGPDTTAAADVAVAFHRAVQDGDGNAACESSGAGNHAGPGKHQRPTLSRRGPGRGPDRCPPGAGHAGVRPGAQVLMDGDMVFLTVFGDHWLITAAGCTSRGDRPYDCAVKGG